MNSTESPLVLQPELLSAILEWDVHNWTHALRFWHARIPCTRESTVLEIGARRGGLSLYFALRGAGRVICSDLVSPQTAAIALHQHHRVNARIEYLGADATRLPLDSASIDIVVAKSVLGGIGSHGHRDRVEMAIGEAYRVLKPGGWLCFAENLRATIGHRALRHAFTSWGHRWYYFDRCELQQMLAAFAYVELETRGFLGLLGRTERQRLWLGRVDDQIAELIPPGLRYLAYGAARRP